MDFIAIWAALRTDAEFARLVRIGINDWGALNSNEKTRVHSFFTELVLHFHGATEQEHLEELRTYITGWENNLLGLLTTPGRRVWWETSKYLWNPPIVTRLESRLVDQKNLPPSWSEGIPWLGAEALDFEHRESAPNKSLETDTWPRLSLRYRSGRPPSSAAQRGVSCLSTIGTHHANLPM